MGTHLPGAVSLCPVSVALRFSCLFELSEAVADGDRDSQPNAGSHLGVLG